ncbi:FAS1 domain-containing protein [Phyllosticta citriasiana]|uniref:FAS1 domain-containing protein n=1 Tax=Phyllosticta citriasiana TaxID=595635 RepID=A0ABR1KS26_9PEZI
MPKKCPLFCIFAITHFIARGLSQEGGDPLLTTISHDPDLTTFYSLFNATGGESGLPGPDLEERFNTPNVGPYTAFAPTNDAFEKLPEEAIKLLTAAPSYQLILALLRTHIAKGSLPAEALNNGSANLTSVEGFKLGFRLEDGGTKINGQAVLSADEPLEAVNGLVYKIDQVIDPFVGYFGEDQNQDNAQNGPNNQEASSQGGCTGTMASILLEDAELSTIASALQIVDPLFDKVLSLDGLGKSPIFFAPSNGAFEQAGASIAVQPSNVDFSSLLLRFGLVPEGIEDGKAKSIREFELVIEGGRINNAVVEKIDCGCNGCVARVSRWIDPIYRLFER